MAESPEMGQPPTTEFATLVIDGAEASLCISREEKYNALNEQLISELINLLEWTAERSVGSTGELVDGEGNPYLRILRISGSGKHFCAGADINMMREAGAKTIDENREDSSRLDQLFNGLWSHPCFTIGLVQGVALGGGQVSSLAWTMLLQRLILKSLFRKVSWEFFQQSLAPTSIAGSVARIFAG